MTPPAITAAPLIHPDSRSDFAWGDRGTAACVSATVHASRLRAGSTLRHPDWFFVSLPDGSVYEVQFRRLCQQLEHPPVNATDTSIALAFERESIQTPEQLIDILKACGL